MYFGKYMGKTAGSWYGLFPGITIEIIDTDTDTGQGGLPGRSQFPDLYPQVKKRSPVGRKKVRITVTMGRMSWQSETLLSDARYDKIIKVDAMFRGMSSKIIEVFGRLNNVMVVKLQPIIRVFKK